VLVAVPCKSRTAEVLVLVMFERAISGWATSICESIMPISGLTGVTGGDGSPRTTKSRQVANADSGSGGGAWARRASRLGSA
jgi:hypothetical protein